MNINSILLSLSLGLLTSTASLAGGHGIIANLDGPENGASGTGEVFANPDGKTLWIEIKVTGMRADALLDDMVGMPIGPIHMHFAPAGETGPIAVPLGVLDDVLSETAEGFTVLIDALDYDSNAKAVGFELDRDGFLDELQKGNIYFNIHTDANPSGGLRGTIGG